MNRSRRGFTLLEIVIVVALTAILMVTVFQALDKVKNNEAHSQRRKDEQKDVYLLFHRLTDLFKNASSFTVFNGKMDSTYFYGTRDGAIFLSRAPLISPFRVLHFVELRFSKHRMLYREKVFRVKEQGLPVSFLELKTEPFCTLLDNVDGAIFRYYAWDSVRLNVDWRKAVNSFEKNLPPEEISLQLSYRGKKVVFIFPRVIIDVNEEEVPGDLFM